MHHTAYYGSDSESVPNIAEVFLCNSLGFPAYSCLVISLKLTAGLCVFEVKLLVLFLYELKYV
jgi:hypothetical protein